MRTSAYFFAEVLVVLFFVFCSIQVKLTTTTGGYFCDDSYKDEQCPDSIESNLCYLHHDFTVPWRVNCDVLTWRNAVVEPDDNCNTKQDLEGNDCGFAQSYRNGDPDCIQVGCSPL